MALVALAATGLAALPLFLSAETIRTELAKRIEAATGRATRIDGPVSFSVFPTARLSAEGIGIAGLGDDSEDFSVESVSFGLSLIPLLSGNIEIYGVTIMRPSILIETDADGRTNWSAVEAQSEPTSPASIEDMIAAAPPPEENAPSGALTALDRLSIGRVTIAGGTLTWRDRESGREEKIESADLDIRVPELDGPATVEGSFVRNGVAHTLKLDVAERPDPSRFEAVPVELTLSSDAATVTAVGTALSGQSFFNGTVEAKGSSLAAFAKGFGAELPDAPAFGAFATAARIDASRDQIRIERFGVDLGGMKVQGGAAIGLDRTRPGIGLKIEADRVDTALFLAKAATGSGTSGGAPNPSGGGEEKIDLSALGLVDANIDFSAKELLIGTVPVTDVGLDLQIVGGGLNATIRSATVNGAPGTGTLTIDNSGAEPAISGNIKMDGLDAGGLVALSGADVPIDAGSVGLDLAFTTHGATQDAVAANLEASGRVSLLNGHASRLGAAGMVGGDTAADEVDDIDIVAQFTSLASPVTAKGGLGWRGERFEVSARGEPRALVMGKVSPVTIEASSARVKFGFNGEAGLSGLGSGSVSLSTSSLRNLLSWIGRPIAPGGGLAGFSIEGAVKLTEDAFSFDQTAFTLDGSRGAGSGRVTFGETPNITADLAMATLDVTPYLVASGATKGTAGGAGGAAPADAGWSSAPIAFDGLRAFDAKLNFKAEQILADKIRIGPANLIVTLAGGRLSAELAEMALYSGTGAGTLSIDGAAAAPSVAASFRLLEIDALPFLTDAVGFSRIEGRGSFAFDLKASGASEAALAAALDGNGTIYVQNGAIRGINIPKMVQTLSVETLLGWQQSSGERTDFTELSGSFAIDKGILVNDDLVIVGPLMRVSGAGRVDIPKRTLAYRVDPKIVASLEGQGGGSGDLEGFAVPIRVEGPWGRPSIYPEIEGILQDPKGALEQLRKLGGGLLGGLTGGGKPQAGGQAPSMPMPTGGLDQLLGAQPDAGPAPETPAAPAPETQAAPTPETPPAETPPAETPTPAETPPLPPPSPVPPMATTPEQPIEAAPPTPEAAAPQPEPTAPSSEPSGTPPTGDPALVQPPPNPADQPPADPTADLLKSLLGQ